MISKDQQEYILSHREKLTTRQMSKHLGLSRAKIEEVLKAPEEEVPSKIESFLASRQTTVMVSIFLIALVVRLLFTYFFSGTPFAEPLTSALQNKLDDASYDSLALAISKGNWFGALPQGAYRAPFYPYFLAALYKLFTHSYSLVHFLQAFLGSISAVLVYFIAKRTFKSYVAALIASLMCAFYAPFLFYENLLLGETLSLFFNLLSFALLIYAMEDTSKKGSKFALLLSGVVLGLSALTRPNTILVGGVLAAYLFLSHFLTQKSFTKAFQAPLIFLMGILIALAPITLKNYKVYHDLIPISAQSGPNLHIGNNALAEGKFYLIREVGTNQEEMFANFEKIAKEKTGLPNIKPSQVSSYWTGVALTWISSNPGSFIALTVKKLALFFNAYEFPDVLDIHFAALFLPALHLGTIQYGLIVVLAIIGFCFARPKNNFLAHLLNVFIISYTASVVFFFVTGRYRLPLVPFLLMYAALGLHYLFGQLKTKRGSLALSLCVLIFATMVIFWPVERVDFSSNYNSLAIAMKYRGDNVAAEKYYRKSIQTSPNYPSPYYNLASLLQESGHFEEAEKLRIKYQQLKEGRYDDSSPLTESAVLTAASDTSGAPSKELVEDVVDTLSQFIPEELTEIGIDVKKSADGADEYYYRGKPLNELGKAVLENIQRQAESLSARQRAEEIELQRSLRR